jgi:hypothetical protein
LCTRASYRIRRALASTEVKEGAAAEQGQTAGDEQPDRDPLQGRDESAKPGGDAHTASPAGVHHDDRPVPGFDRPGDRLGASATRAHAPEALRAGLRVDGAAADAVVGDRERIGVEIGDPVVRDTREIAVHVRGGTDPDEQRR